MNEGKPVTIDEASVYTGLAKSYLYKLTSLGKIPYYRPNGGRIFFKPADLENFVFRGRRSADYEVADHADAILNDWLSKRLISTATPQ